MRTALHARTALRRRTVLNKTSMPKKIKTAIILLCLMGLLGMPYLAGAIEINNPLEHESFEELVGAVIDFIFWVALAIVPLMVLIGAFYLLTAGGDPKRVKTGQNFIMYAAIGLAVILFSKGLIAVLKYVLGWNPPAP